MSTSQALLDTQLQHLKDARAIVLKQPDYWPQVLTTSMGMVTSTNSLIEVRRWCADFLAESFSTPMIDLSAKQELAVTCLDGLLQLSEETEAGILKSVVQCSASVYPIIFRYMYVLAHFCGNTLSSIYRFGIAPAGQQKIGLLSDQTFGPLDAPTAMLQIRGIR